MRITAVVSFLSLWSLCLASEILMTTLGGTKSHKIGFWELARGLIARNHSVTFINAFPPDFHMEGLEEITPANLVFFVRNFTNWDLVGSRMKGEDPVPVSATMDFIKSVCTATLGDPEIKELMESKKRFDLIIMDGAYPECTLAFAHHYKVPFMYLNTVAFNTVQFAKSGSPTPYSITPFFNIALTDDMNFKQRLVNTAMHLLGKVLHDVLMNYWLYPEVKKHIGDDMPNILEYSKNVSFILQFGHHSVSLPRPFLPNVAEIGCIHCKPANPLRKDLEDFINEGGDNGFIFFSMGSSVKASNMPEDLRKILVKTFARLPYQVLWKWEDDPNKMADLPHNVMLSRWLPQQDLLGHRKIRAFVTHGGLLSMYETVYHGVPIVTMPVFCDHDANAAKAVSDGYAIKLELQDLTADMLWDAINRAIKEPKYKEAVKRRQILLRDLSESPIDTAVYWIEYVIRHKGASHLQSPGRFLNVIQYYSIDTLVIIFCTVLFIFYWIYWLLTTSFGYLWYLASGTRKIKME